MNCFAYSNIEYGTYILVELIVNNPIKVNNILYGNTKPSTNGFSQDGSPIGLFADCESLGFSSCQPFKVVLNGKEYKGITYGSNVKGLPKSFIMLRN